MLEENGTRSVVELVIYSSYTIAGVHIKQLEYLAFVTASFFINT